jgi:uncharacterized protein
MMKLIRQLSLATAIFVFIVAIVSLVGIGAQSPVSAQSPTPSPFEPVRSVTVTGVGQARVIPDEAVVVIGVESQALTAREAITENNEQMQAVLDALQEAGIPSTDIQTRTLSLFPRYDGDRQAPGGGLGEITGYTAANQVEVRLRQIANVGDIIDAAIMAGANTITGIRFEVTDPIQVLDQVRVEAMNDARRKAEQLAELAGASLGNVMSISEFSRTPRPVFQEAAVMDVAAAVPIEGGTETIEVEVQVVWFLE